MTDEQVAKMISYMAGECQLAIVHLGTVLEQKHVIAKTDLADTFDRTANLLPLDCYCARGPIAEVQG